MDTITDNGKDITRTRRLYTYHELSDKAKRKAMDDLRQALYETLDSELVHEALRYHVLLEFTGKDDHDGTSWSWNRHFGEHIGKGLRIEWSLSHCQGDGVALYGRIYREYAPNLTWAEGVEYVDLVRNSWGTYYSHYNTFNVEHYDNEGDYVDVGGESEITGELRRLCRNLARVGYASIDAYTSEDYALETIDGDSLPRKYDEDGDCVDPVWHDRA